MVHGPDCGRREPTIEVPLAELREMVALSFAGVGLSCQWADTATTEELAALQRAAKFALVVRDGEWEQFERQVAGHAAPRGATTGRCSP